MRNFLDAIMQFIGAASLNDDEFATASGLPDNPGVYTVDVYNVCLAIVDARELVSETRDRLTYLFKAKGIAVTPTDKAKSNLFIGSPL